MLSEYSSQALALLIDALPDLQGLATTKEEYFIIESASPSGHHFGLYSDDEQITVEFAEYHCHFGTFAGTTVEEDVAEAISLIQSLRVGSLVLVAWYKGEEYMGSYLMPPNERPEQVVSGPNQVFKIRKWLE